MNSQWVIREGRSEVLHFEEAVAFHQIDIPSREKTVRRCDSNLG